MLSYMYRPCVVTSWCVMVYISPLSLLSVDFACMYPNSQVMSQPVGVKWNRGCCKQLLMDTNFVQCL